MRITRNTYTQHGREAGFTLLDLAIIMLIIGFISAPLINEYHNWSKRANSRSTTDKIFDLENALEQYYFTNQHYPCPAVPTTGPNTVIVAGQPGFGQENRAAPILPATVGDCIEVGAPQPVLYGAIPFRALNLPEEAALDAWRRKLTYAVTTTKTHPATYSAAPGVITITKPLTEQSNPGGDFTCQPNISDPNVSNIDLVLLSHGATGAGAYNNDGALTSICPVTADIDLDGVNDGDGENCNNDPTFRFTECTADTANGVTFYDDIMYGQYGGGNLNAAGKWNSTPKRRWEEGNSPTDSGSDAGYIGIGHRDPQHAVDVMGNIKATNLDSSTDATDEKKGNALARQYCDSDGNDCFNPNSIAGDDADMQCRGTNTGVTGIGSNKAKCTTLPFSERSCPPNEFITGITSSGALKCGK
jgi:type II secretory pathway pseudopilin PulG